MMKTITMHLFKESVNTLVYPTVLIVKMMKKNILKVGMSIFRRVVLIWKTPMKKKMNDWILYTACSRQASRSFETEIRLTILDTYCLTWWCLGFGTRNKFNDGRYPRMKAVADSFHWSKS